MQDGTLVIEDEERSPSTPVRRRGSEYEYYDLESPSSAVHERMERLTLKKVMRRTLDPKRFNV